MGHYAAVAVYRSREERRLDPSSLPRPLDHHDEDDAALVPSADPAYVPAVDAVAHVNRLEEAQELA
jgi:hypothetical protein